MLAEVVDSLIIETKAGLLSEQDRRQHVFVMERCLPSVCTCGK
jgi:hypothetical protein